MMSATKKGGPDTPSLPCQPMDRLCNVNLDRPNGQPMLRKVLLSKWTIVEWTVYITLIWTVQMEDSPMNRICYVNLEKKNL